MEIPTKYVDSNTTVFLDFIYFIAQVKLQQIDLNKYKLVKNSRVNNYDIYTLKYRHNDYETWTTWNFLNYYL